MRKKIIIILGIVLLVGIATFLIVNNTSSTLASPTKIVEKDSVQKEEKPIVYFYGFNQDSVNIIKNKVNRNESLSQILHPYNVSFQMINQLAVNSKNIFDVRKIATTKDYEIICGKDSSNTAKCFIYHPNAIDYVLFHLDDSLSVEILQHEVELKEKTISGIIESSLYQTMIDEGASPLLANALADVYAWQIDFFSVQKGDNFKVVYDEKIVNGEAIGIGNIKTANFHHANKDYYAFQFTQDSVTEYFDEDGNSLRKAFLKAPLNYSRISSRFSNSRLHPVLKIRRPHHGVDYAAPLGTPVQAVGDGKIVKIGYYGGAGNYIKIKHNSTYTTAYMHLSKFANGLRAGSTVTQSQVIGYVGSTGLSTGPHLDFRFYKNGTPLDPLKVDPPSSTPVKEENMEAFNKIKAEQKKKLD